MMTGESTAIGGNHVSDLNMSYDPYVIGEDKYLYFYVDMINDPTFEASGRINGACFDIAGIDYDTPGANSFDLVFMAWFRTVDEAQSYIEAYLTALGWDNGEDTTATATEAPTETSTEAIDTTTDHQPPESDATETASKSEGQETEYTEAPQTDAKDNAPTQSSGGCGSIVGFNTIAILIISSIGITAFKKKD